MSEVPLSDEHNKAILADAFIDSLSDLDRGTQQREVLKKIHQLLDSQSPERYIYEKATGVDVLQIIRPNDLLRIYCKLVMGVPKNNKEYNILYIFYVDKHKYRNRDLKRWDRKAKSLLDRIESLQSISDVDQHLEEHNAFDPEDIQKLIDTGGV